MLTVCAGFRWPARCSPALLLVETSMGNGFPDDDGMSLLNLYQKSSHKEQPFGCSPASLSMTEARLGGCGPVNVRAGPHLGGGPDFEEAGSDPAGPPSWARFGHRQRLRGLSHVYLRKDDPQGDPACYVKWPGVNAAFSAKRTYATFSGSLGAALWRLAGTGESPLAGLCCP